jgi:hypothetical protein
LIAASGLAEGEMAALPLPIPAEPVVMPESRLDAAPDDCAVPALLVPGGRALAPPCARDTAGAASMRIAASMATADVLVIGKSPFNIQRRGAGSGSCAGWPPERQERDVAMRKLIAFDDDTAAKLKQLARDRMATFQELADEAFADLLKKHGIPIDLKDALRKSARESGASAKVIPLSKPPKKR